MKVECPFKGCNGRVDVVKSVEGSLRDVGHNVPWLMHSIMCRKCNNFIGNFDLEAVAGMQLDPKKKWAKKTKGVPVITNPATKKTVRLKSFKQKDLNPYLKEWARI